MFTRDTFTWGKCHFTIENVTQYNRNVKLPQVNVSRVYTALNIVDWLIDCITNFDRLFLAMKFLCLFNNIVFIFMLISSHHSFLEIYQRARVLCVLVFSSIFSFSHVLMFSFLIVPSVRFRTPAVTRIRSQTIATGRTKRELELTSEAARKAELCCPTRQQAVNR